METQHDCDARSSRKRHRLRAVLVVGVLAAMAWAPGVVSVSSASAAPVAASLDGESDLLLRVSVGDEQHADDSTRSGGAAAPSSRPCTHANPTNGKVGDLFETSANETNGVSSAHLVPGSAGMVSDRAHQRQPVLYGAMCEYAGQPDADKRQNWGLITQWQHQRTVRTVSNYDGKCADVLNNSDYDGAWVGAWTCNSTYGSTNQQWTLTDGDGSVSGLSKWPLSTIVPAQLAKEYIGGLARQALQRKTPGSVTFCNWRAYVAWATVNYARLTPSMGFQNGSRPPTSCSISVRRCPSPRGRASPRKSPFTSTRLRAT